MAIRHGRLGPTRVILFLFYTFITHMQPQREGYDEPEPIGHPDSVRAMYSVGWPVNRLARRDV